MQEKDNSGSVAYWLAMTPSWARAIVAVGFMFTIWSVMTGFDLGNIMNKYADAHLQRMTMSMDRNAEANERAIDILLDNGEKLNSMIEVMGGFSGTLDDHGQRINELETTTTLISKWACVHEVKNPPDFCEALHQ